MAEVDTSSYPRAAVPTSPLDIAGKLGSLQSQSLQINQQKLSQANEALGYLTRAMSAIGPNGSKDQYKRAGMDAVNAGLVPQNMLGIWTKKIDDAKSPQEFYNETMTAAADHGAMFQYHLGQNQVDQTGQRSMLYRAPLAVGAKPTIQGSIPTEAPPTFEQYDKNTGQRSNIGNVPLNEAPPSSGFNNRLNAAPIVPTPVPTQSIRPPLPVGAMDPNAIPGMRPGERAIGAQVQPATNGSYPTAPTPLFEEGKKQFANDQELATQKLTAIKPAIQALPLIEGLTTGIGTETYNKALAGLSNLGLLPSGMTNKVAVYQELSKKLANYVSNNPVGQRSDAAQTLAEASSPSPKTQINPALIKLTKDAIILDRVQALRPGAFKNADFSKYGQHRSLFPAKIDERAVGLDLMKSKERNDLLDEMKKKRNTVEGKKFWSTLSVVDDQGFIDTTNQ